MAILDRKTYKEIEWHLYHYFDLRREIREFREKVLNSSTPMFGNVGGGHSYHSDPTALKAIRLSKPELIEKEKWVEVIEKVKMRYANTEKGKLLQMKYFEELAREHICKTLYIDRATYFRWKNEIVLYAALLAQKYHLIDIEKVS